MTFPEPLRLKQKSKNIDDISGSLYCMLAPSSYPDYMAFSTSHSELSEYGLEIVYEDYHESSRIYLHHQSGSAIIIESDYQKDSVTIYGDKKEQALSDLERLAKVKGFELEEIPKRINTSKELRGATG